MKSFLKKNSIYKLLLNLSNSFSEFYILKKITYANEKKNKRLNIT